MYRSYSPYKAKKAKPTDIVLEILKNPQINVLGIKLILALVNKGADVNATDDNGLTVVMLLVMAGYSCIKPFLLKNGVDFKKNIDKAVYVAIDNGDLNFLKYLVGCGLDINIKNENGSSLITYAIRIGHRFDEDTLYKIVEYLIYQGVEVNSKDRLTNTALISAINTSSIYLVKLLLDNGADINTKCFNDNTPLMEAALGRNKYIIKILLEAGAIIPAKGISSRNIDDLSLYLVYQINEEIHEKKYNIFMGQVVKNGIDKIGIDKHICKMIKDYLLPVS